MIRALPIGGSAPKPPGFAAFFSPEWLNRGRRCRPLRPFRPLRRSLGLLPSIALSRPAQVRSVCNRTIPLATRNQRTAICHFLPCLSDGVHSSVLSRVSLYAVPPGVCTRRDG